jgi:hypothetical protein
MLPGRGATSTAVDLRVFLHSRNMGSGEPRLPTATPLTLDVLTAQRA